MGRLVVVEGLDGAGKNTLTGKLTETLRERGATIARIAFPRYGTGVHADLVADALHGRLGDLSESVYGMALLFALDRRDAIGEIQDALATHDVLLLDRYVASNAAYCAARLGEPADGPFVSWLYELEVARFGLPAPDLHVLLRVPPEVAGQRARQRERADAARSRDAYESNAELQARCARVYDELAEARWLAPWHVVDGAIEPDVSTLAAEVLGQRAGY
ncbi:dTMP kinase [Tamaricihabitans halophyticus]|uniref:dTMP kinase n=1 Tax=Tamaricihabitans halophyticus TaxID=1262583 RepID=UPI0010501669|nr:dTMP kinase [Tamaricihabitans halophyticus]